MKLAFKAGMIGAVLAMVGACSDGDANTQGSYPVDDSNVVGTIKGEMGIYEDIVFGDPNAPVTLLEYGSLTCGACAAFANQIYPEIEKDYIDTGKVKFVFRNYLLNGLDLQASSVMRCTTEATARSMIKEMYAKQNTWLRAQDQVGALAALARRSGMSRVKFDQCANNQEMSDFLAEMQKEGAGRMGVTGTPTLYVNGARLANFASETIRAALDAAL